MDSSRFTNDESHNNQSRLQCIQKEYKLYINGCIDRVVATGPHVAGYVAVFGFVIVTTIVLHGPACDVVM